MRLIFRVRPENWLVILEVSDLKLQRFSIFMCGIIFILTSSKLNGLIYRFSHKTFIIPLLDHYFKHKWKYNAKILQCFILYLVFSLQTLTIRRAARESHLYSSLPFLSTHKQSGICFWDKFLLLLVAVHSITRPLLDKIDPHLEIRN